MRRFVFATLYCALSSFIMVVYAPGGLPMLFGIVIAVFGLVAWISVRSREDIATVAWLLSTICALAAACFALFYAHRGGYTHAALVLIPYGMMALAAWEPYLNPAVVPADPPEAETAA
jgi:hypothetical protein